MPDLKSELKKLEALKFDDEGETDVSTMPSADEQHGSVSVRMFNIIRDNPGCDRGRLLAKALAAGIGMSSSSSLLTQFARRGLLRTVDSAGGLTYFTTSQEYKPGYVKREKKAKKADKVAAPKAAPQDASVQDLLNTMSIVKARALYDELKKIFGG